MFLNIDPLMETICEIQFFFLSIRINGILNRRELRLLCGIRIRRCWLHLPISIWWSEKKYLPGIFCTAYPPILQHLVGVEYPPVSQNYPNIRGVRDRFFWSAQKVSVEYAYVSHQFSTYHLRSQIDHSVWQLRETSKQNTEWCLQDSRAFASLNFESHELSFSWSQIYFSCETPKSADLHENTKIGP